MHVRGSNSQVCGEDLDRCSVLRPATGMALVTWWNAVERQAESMLVHALPTGCVLLARSDHQLGQQ